MTLGLRWLTTALLLSVAIDGAHAAPPACVGSELATAKAALEQAKSALAKTIANLDSGDSATVTKATTWLGIRNSGDAQQVKNLLVRALGLGGSPSFLCDKVTYKTLGDVYGHALATDPFIIKLGAFFWTAPDTGFDSKPGTIVHEMTHFSSVGATADSAGDPTAAKNLARSDPAGARRNANNYEYFVESVAFGLHD
jgi:peptidyl-Lys metalloendopeptidase